jgi:hypothetical protein
MQSSRDTVASLMSSTSSASSSTAQPLTSRARAGGSNMHGILTSSEFIAKSTHKEVFLPATARAMVKPYTSSDIFSLSKENVAQQPSAANNGRVTRSHFTISHEKQPTEPLHTGKSILKANKNISNISLAQGAHDASKVQRTTIKMSEISHKNTSSISSSEVGFGSSKEALIPSHRAVVKADKNVSKVFTNSLSPGAKITGKLHVQAVIHAENSRPQTAQGAKKNTSQLTISSAGFSSKGEAQVLPATGRATVAYHNKKNTSTIFNNNGGEQSQPAKRVRSEMENILQQKTMTPAGKLAKTRAGSSPAGAFKPSMTNILAWE